MDPQRTGRTIVLAAALLAATTTHAEPWQDFTTQGLPGSQGIAVRLRHPAGWKPVPADDPQVLAELRGDEGDATGIVQVGRGRRREDARTLCAPERAPSLLQDVAAREPGTRVTDVFARTLADRPAFELRYERKLEPGFLAVRSVIVCLHDTRVVVSCGAMAPRRDALAAVEPMCRTLLDGVAVDEQP